MASTKNVMCPVDVPDSYGEYANAFRIMQDGNDVVLDFCVYSEQDNKARLVSRVRVRPDFLEVVLARLQAATSPTAKLEPQLFVMPEVRGDN